MSVKISTWNVKGSNNVVKKKSILNSLKKDLTHIAFLQETHLTDDEHRKYCREWVGQIFFHPTPQIKGGLLLLYTKIFPSMLQPLTRTMKEDIYWLKGCCMGKLFS